MPDRIEVNGRWYVAEDTIPRDSPPPAIERSMSVSELSEASGVPRRTIYDAIERGELARFAPNGCSRGWRVRASEFARWVQAREARCA